MGNLRDMGYIINYKQALSNQKTGLFSWRALSIVAYLRFTGFPLEIPVLVAFGINGQNKITYEWAFYDSSQLPANSPYK